jgi:hypothetical protein
MKELSGFEQAQTLFLWPYWIQKTISAQRIDGQGVDVIGGRFESFGHGWDDRYRVFDKSV